MGRLGMCVYDLSTKINRGIHVGIQTLQGPRLSTFLARLGTQLTICAQK